METEEAVAEEVEMSGSAQGQVVVRQGTEAEVDWDERGEGKVVVGQGRGAPCPCCTPRSRLAHLRRWVGRMLWARKLMRLGQVQADVAGWLGQVQAVAAGRLKGR